VWTPRRLLLFLIGVALFTAAYAAYAGVFGRLDGLPPLPAAFLVRRAADDIDRPLPARDVAIDTKLQRAFGPNCIETSFNHKIELQKNGVILATNDVRIDPDGRCRLKPFSIAVVKDRGPTQDPEIYTIHSDEAFLLFDEPAKNLTEIGKRRIVGCDLVSDPSLLSPDPRCHRITCVHNRGTADPDDDLTMETAGPVTYRELPSSGPPADAAPPQIQTTSAVKLTDKRGSPRSTTVTAQGMKIYLMAATGGPAPPTPKGQPKTGAISGVRKVVLPETVAMDVWMDPQGGFISGGRPTNQSPQAGERSNVQITTPGAFVYNIGKDADTARFEMRPAVGAADRPGFVQVVRPVIKNDVTLYDRLDCETLELQFGHKPATPAAAADTATSEPGSNLQWVHAWGQYVVLTSQAENMQANCKDLFHDALTKQTTLKGTPDVVALKDGHEIHAPELVFVNSDAKGAQDAYANGAGYFKGHMSGEQAGKEGPRAFTAVWRDKMHYRKDQGEETITLIGSASFEDPDRKQSLAGEQIKLTMAPDPTAKGAAGDPKLKPRRLEVTGRVAADTQELKITDTEQLVLLFKDAPPQAKPAATGTATPNAVPGVQPLPADGQPPMAKAAEPDKKPTMSVSARSVQAFLLAYESGPTELDTVHCEGRVRVHQDPTPPQEKPVDMRGDSLDVTRFPEGYKLVVTGDLDRPAEVHLPDLSLTGPTVILHQVDNVAEVQGPGGMKILSTTDFQGNKLDKPSELHIYWRQEMHFNGILARFQGSVQADQDNTKLTCHGMQVTLDRPVRLNQQQPGAGPAAKAANVEKVVCETTGKDGASPVSVVDSLRENGAITRYQRIESQELAVFKSEGRLEAPGPGEVRIMQKGPKDMQAPPPRPVAQPVSKSKTSAPPLPPAAPAQEEQKLTWVRYGQKLTVYNDKHIANFRKNVEVLHIPFDNPVLHQKFDDVVAKLPPRALYLKCDELEVYSQESGPQKYHVLKAMIRAEVQVDNYYGQADVITYDESKQQIIFEGTPGRPAKINEVPAKGHQAKGSSGQKFIYNRITGQFTGINVNSISTK
jgi:hypothetical protein